MLCKKWLSHLSHFFKVKNVTEMSWMFFFCLFFLPTMNQWLNSLLSWIMDKERLTSEPTLLFMRVYNASEKKKGVVISFEKIWQKVGSHCRNSCNTCGFPLKIPSITLLVISLEQPQVLKMVWSTSFLTPMLFDKKASSVEMYESVKS